MVTGRFTNGVQVLQQQANRHHPRSVSTYQRGTEQDRWVDLTRLAGDIMSGSLSGASAAHAIMSLVESTLDTPLVLMRVSARTDASLSLRSEAVTPVRESLMAASGHRAAGGHMLTRLQIDPASQVLLASAGIGAGLAIPVLGQPGSWIVAARESEAPFTAEDESFALSIGLYAGKIGESGDTALAQRMRTAAFDLSAQALYLYAAETDPAGEMQFRLVDLNPVGELGLQVSRRDAVGRDFWEICPPERQADLIETFRRVVANQEVISTPATCIEMYGRSWWLSEHVSPTAGGVIFSVSDETERGEALEALRKNEAHFRSLVQHGTDFVLVIDLEGRVSYASPSVERLLGYSRADHVGHPAIDFVHPDDREPMLEKFHQVPSGQQTVAPVEFRLRRADGHYMWVEAVATNLRSDPDVMGFVMNARDITERRAAQIALIEREQHLNLALDAAVMAAWDWNPATETVVRSPGMSALFGLPPGTLDDSERSVLEFVHPEDLSKIADMDFRHLEAGAPYDVTIRVIWPDGSIHWLRDRGERQPVDADGYAHVFGVTTDITAIMEAEARYREAEGRFRTLVEQIPAVTYVTQPSTTDSWHNHYVSPQIEDLLGYTPEEWAADPALWYESIYPADREIVDAGLEALSVSNEFRCDARWIHRDGRIVWVRDRAVLLNPNSAGPAVWQGVMYDITEEKRAEEDARFQAELLKTVPAAVIGMRPDGVISHWNPYAEQLFGWNEAESIGSGLIQLLSVQHEDGRLVTDADIAAMSGRVSEDLTVLRKDGVRVPVHSRAANIVDVNGQITGYVSISVDLTERRELEARLRDIAYHDAVTRLPNRIFFLEALHEAIAGASVQRPAAVIFLDLDQFKFVNDSLGHEVGDLLLAGVAERLQNCFRPGDVLARFGGDEFAILCNPIKHMHDAHRIASRMLEALSEPFVFDGREVFASASAGITIATSPRQTTGELLREADVALYSAKAAGRGRWATFDRTANDRVLHRMAMETDLRHALEREQLELYYQPIVDLGTNSIHGFEALLRWRHPEYGMVSPADFIPLAEETGLIVPIGDWVIEEASRQAVRWSQQRADQPLIVAVNVSPRQFRGAALENQLRRVLADTGLHPWCLKLEVTEQALSDDPEATSAFLGTLKHLGVQLALDDFGTGYSSLGRIHRLPLDVVKIDRTFISGLETESASCAIVRAVATLANSLGLVTVAEGIETEAQRRIALELGCQRGQGYLFAKPMPQNAVLEFLQQ